MRNPFRYFNSSPEVIRLTVMMYIHVNRCDNFKQNRAAATDIVWPVTPAEIPNGLPSNRAACSRGVNLTYAIASGWC